MLSGRSVTTYIAFLKDGENATRAQHEIFNRYFSRLAAIADKRLRGVHHVDGEDAALSALNSFLRRPQDFDYVVNGDTLWKTLARLVCNRAINSFRKENTAKRGGGHVRNFGAREMPTEASIADELTPEVSDTLIREIRFAINELADERVNRGDKLLHEVAVLKLRGYTNVEIGKKIGRTRENVAVKLKAIRAIWQAHCSEEHWDNQ